MNPAMSSGAPHSADQFGPQRDFWWNPDFLDLMAKRWRLAEAESMADIGCGKCHWSRLLYPRLRPSARLTCVDREAQWLAESGKALAQTFPSASPNLFNFVQADATNLPIADNTFDVVTCQTVLMHLPNARAALREMHRILEPGGILICSEPNNFWNYVPFDSLTLGEDVEIITRRFEFWLRYHRGLTKSGRGDHTIGDRLPGYFAELGLKDIAVCQSDQCGDLFPPYSTPAQQAIIEETRRTLKTGTGPWDADEARRLVVAGGGSEAFANEGFAEVKQRAEREQAAIDRGEFHAGNETHSYLVSGRKG
jgi:ubiquinone/menaquinone biosynthesis C-methylase UbiE